MNYELYLFSNLLKLYDKKFAEKPYDVQYDLLPAYYKHFENSKHNVGSEGLYECILNYLKDLFPADKKLDNNYEDISIKHTKNSDGSYTLYCYDNAGELKQKQKYYGYSLSESKKLFNKLILFSNL